VRAGKDLRNGLPPNPSISGWKTSLERNRHHHANTKLALESRSWVFNFIIFHWSVKSSDCLKGGWLWDIYIQTLAQRVTGDRGRWWRDESFWANLLWRFQNVLGSGSSAFGKMMGQGRTLIGKCGWACEDIYVWYLECRYRRSLMLPPLSWFLSLPSFDWIWSLKAEIVHSFLHC
jgi:hypothetical protein